MKRIDSYREAGLLQPDDFDADKQPRREGGRQAKVAARPSAAPSGATDKKAYLAAINQCINFRIAGCDPYFLPRPMDEGDLGMNDALVAGAGEMVEAGIRETGIPLTVELKHYLAITVARYMREEIEVDRLTIRVARAIDERASRDVLRSLADQCLVACSVFERRLRRGGGSLHHYVGLGRVAYDAASMTPQAWGFSGMRDVLATASGMRASNRMQDLIDAARSGSEIARDTLAQANVVVFKGGSLLR